MLPDRIFFGHGACHILAGVFLKHPPLQGFYAERIIPGDGFYGNHIYVTDGTIAFDYHGYSARKRLLDHHSRSWSAQYADTWNCILERVDFDLLNTADLNDRKMQEPDQYLKDPIPRAMSFISQINLTNITKKPDLRWCSCVHLASLLKIAHKKSPAEAGAESVCVKRGNANEGVSNRKYQARRRRRARCPKTPKIPKPVAIRMNGAGTGLTANSGSLIAS